MLWCEGLVCCCHAAKCLPQQCRSARFTVPAAAAAADERLGCETYQGWRCDCGMCWVELNCLITCVVDSYVFMRGLRQLQLRKTACLLFVKCVEPRVPSSGVSSATSRLTCVMHHLLLHHTAALNSVHVAAFAINLSQHACTAQNAACYTAPATCVYGCGRASLARRVAMSPSLHNMMLVLHCTV
jgi:hypothetical protein